MGKIILKALVSTLLVLAASQAWADGHGVNCTRFAPGSVVLPPPDIFSQNGALNVQLNYFTRVDQDGRSLFCFQTPDGLEGPTLRLNPGDQLNILAANDVPPGTAVEQVSNSTNQCGDLEMYTSSLNIHYHGTTTSPKCHQDQVIHTIINSGEKFQYNVAFPTYSAAGLYWYHTHIHGIAEATVQGGASGALIVSGIQNYQPAVAGLPERVLVIRDQPVAGNSTPGNTCAGNSNVTPSWDLDINYVPLEFQAATCNYTPAVIEMQAGQQEFWRVANAGADSILDIQIQEDGAPQPLQLVSLDGVVINSQNGQQRGTTKTVTDILLAPAARAEFIVTAPNHGKHASFVTLNIDTGPDGDVDPLRTIATIKTDTPTQLPKVPAVTNAVQTAMAAAQELGNQQPTVHRTLYFSEVLSDPTNPQQPDQLLHHGRRRDAAAVRSEQSTRHHHASGSGRRLDDPEQDAGKSRIPLPPDPFPGGVAERILGAPGNRPVPRHDPDPLLVGQRALPERDGALGLPRRGHRRLRLSLPHPRSRGRRHDGDHPGSAAEFMRRGAD